MQGNDTIDIEMAEVIRVTGVAPGGLGVGTGPSGTPTHPLLGAADQE